MKKAALFDMDGTLVDNTPAHLRAFSVFCDRYGIRDWAEKLKGCLRHGQRGHHAPHPPPRR